MKFTSHTPANGSRSAQSQPTVILALLMCVIVLVAVCNAFNANEASATSIVG